MEEKVYEYLKALVAVPGISDTDDEKMAVERIGEILKAQSYFQVYPENFGEIMIPGDAKKRPLVYGLVRGNKSSGRTVIFTGHYDVVGVEDYGPLKPLAFSMEELKAAFVAAVKEKKIAEFLKAQGCEATEAEVTEFLKAKQDAEGEIADEELDAVAGGCNDVEFMISVGTLGAYCLGRAIDSATGNGSAKEHWGEGQILCNA